MSTYVLFIGVLCLIALLSSLLIVNGSYESQLDAGIATAQIQTETKQVSAFESVTDSVNIAVSSQGFVIALFPIYSGMA